MIFKSHTDFTDYADSKSLRLAAGKPSVCSRMGHTSDSNVCFVRLVRFV